MKKILITLTLALAMLVGMAIPTFAATVSVNGGTATTDVNGTYTGSFTSTGEVVSVDVAWGAMSFTYSASGTKTWNPTTHQYDENKTAGSWTASGNTVTVTNHSNVAVNANLAFAGESGITGKFYTAAENGTETSTIALATAEGTAYNNAPNGTAYLIVDGAIKADGKIGTITVTIAQQ